MDSIQDLLTQLRRNPDRPDLHNSLGRLYQQEGRDAEAAKHFLTAARLFANAESPSRNPNKAVAILKKMVRDYPDSPDPYYLLAEVYAETESQHEAVEVYRMLSDVYRRGGKPLMAVSVFDKVVGTFPENQEAWVRFAELNSEARMPFHAAQAFLRAAGLAVGQGQAAEAYRLALEGLRLDPENAEAREILRGMVSGPAGGGLDLRRALEVVSELERGGQPEAALELAQILSQSPVADEASRLAGRTAAQKGLGREAEEPEAPPLPAPRQGEGRKVLIVDDEQEIRLLLEQILKAEGYQVLAASDGEEGLAMFRRERPGLVVSDAMLPKLHGFELCRRIKEESGQAARVMILTAVYKKYKYKGKVQKEFNVDEYLDKPFQITEFLDTFRRLAETAPAEAPFPGAAHEPSPEPAAEALKVAVCLGPDRETASRIERQCEKLGCPVAVYPEPIDLFRGLMKSGADVVLLADRLQRIEPYLAAWIVRHVLDLPASTIVLVTRDPRLLDGPLGEFSHRIAAPVEPTTLEAVLRLHRQQGVGGTAARKGAIDERRIEAVVRSKVERILKGQSQIEESYARRVAELEAEIARLRQGSGGG